MDAQNESPAEQAGFGMPRTRARDTRFNIRLKVPMERDNGMSETICIENLSIWGFQATCHFPPETGEAVIVTIGDLGEFEGVVRWQRDYRFGVHTFEKIDIQALPKAPN
ncbi:MAG: hypothetical protein AAGE37_01750 [Pseudomonadota bacterium]